MILKEIKNYLKENKRSTLDEISFGIKQDSGVVKVALNEWINKGKVITQKTEHLCTGCSGGCSSNIDGNDSFTIYMWVE